jgi:hypothetical protein
MALAELIGTPRVAGDLGCQAGGRCRRGVAWEDDADAWASSAASAPDTTGRGSRAADLTPTMRNLGPASSLLRGGSWKSAGPRRGTNNLADHHRVDGSGAGQTVLEHVPIDWNQSI